MFEIDEKTQNIRITRGDSGLAESELYIGEGEDAVLYEMQEGDVISLGVKADYEDAECIFQKDVYENPAVFEFVPADTKDLEFGTYYFDVQFDDNVPYPTEGYDITQITTINQAIWYCLGELIRKAPNAKIVVQTPMNGWAYGGDFASNWGIGTALSQSGTLADIHDDIKYWADYYGLQVLDMTYNNSCVNRRNIQTALVDGSHPSDITHMQLARSVWAKLGF